MSRRRDYRQLQNKLAMPYRHIYRAISLQRPICRDIIYRQDVWVHASWYKSDYMSLFDDIDKNGIIYILTSYRRIIEKILLYIRRLDTFYWWHGIPMPLGRLRDVLNFGLDGLHGLLME